MVIEQGAARGSSNLWLESGSRLVVNLFSNRDAIDRLTANTLLVRCNSGTCHESNRVADTLANLDLFCVDYTKWDVSRTELFSSFSKG